MTKLHDYQARIEWTGNTGSGTSGYRDYERSHTIRVPDKSVIEASSDPAFCGDPERYNPEELFLASLSSCHMLWFLHLCSMEGVVVTEYSDDATGVMEEQPDGSGRFTLVTLRPVVTVSEERMRPKLPSIHQEANKKCFIANSCNFEVNHIPVSRLKDPDQ